MSRWQAIREECCRANRRLGTSGLVDLTFGNVSVLDPEAGVLALKPSGVAYCWAALGAPFSEAARARELLRAGK